MKNQWIRIIGRLCICLFLFVKTSFSQLSRYGDTTHTLLPSFCNYFSFNGGHSAIRIDCYNKQKMLLNLDTLTNSSFQIDSCMCIGYPDNMKNGVYVASYKNISKDKWLETKYGEAQSNITTKIVTTYPNEIVSGDTLLTENLDDPGKFWVHIRKYYRTK